MTYNYVQANKTAIGVEVTSWDAVQKKLAYLAPSPHQLV